MSLDRHTRRCNHGLFYKHVMFFSANTQVTQRAQQKPFGTQPPGNAITKLSPSRSQSASPGSLWCPVAPIVLVRSEAHFAK